MAESISVTQVSAMFKEIYADKFLKASEVETSLQELIPYDPESAPGDEYVQAIQMTGEWGFTLRAAGGSGTSMNNAIPMKVERATAIGSIIDFQSVVEIEVMKRAMSSKQSFRNHVGLRMEGMRDSMKRLVEINTLYGGEELGIISSASNSGAVVTAVLTPASWAGGFWAGTENLPLDIYDTTDATKRNTAAVTVTGYDLETRTLTLTCEDSTVAAAIVATDKIWLRGATSSTVLPGISKIIKNQTATINNISAITYPLWRGVNYAVNGQLNMAALLQADARVAERAAGKKVEKKVLLGPKNYAILNADLSGSRKYDGSYSKVKGTNGVGAIEFYSPNGMLVVESHKYVKDGDAFVVNPDKWKRIGPSDITFEIPGSGGNFFQLVPGKPQYEYRGYSHQAPFCSAPASNAVLTGLVVPT